MVAPLLAPSRRRSSELTQPLPVGWRLIASPSGPTPPTPSAAMRCFGRQVTERLPIFGGDEVR